jgi:PhzF family phenazine biosynthesis protein
MTQRRFAQVDVFTDVPLLGNPVAVVLDSDGLSTEQMQAFCDWTNLSEATFVLPPTDPEADYRVRIFCPGRELPFAGHPTLGTCHAWLEAGGAPKRDAIMQECGVGLVPIRRDASSGRLAFAAPPRQRSGPLDEADVDELVAALGIRRDDVVAHEWCDNGPGWRALLLRSADVVLAVRPDPVALAGLDVGIAGVHEPGGAADLEVRAFFPGNGGALAEDPVTGSLNAALGQWLIGSGRMPAHYVARQGTALGRDGRVSVEQVDGQVWVGGASVSVLQGAADL